MLAFAAAGCATNPATGQRQFSLISEEQELAAGRENDAQVRKEMGVYGDRALQEYVTSVGLRLAAISERPGLPWHFTVVDVPAINAFALPGGYIYITRGILPFLDDESQLAGVLGHEIGHVTARHSVQQYSKATGAQLGVILGSIFMPGGAQTAQLGATGLGVLFLKNSRDDEAQADELGVRYASRAGWDPAGVPRMLTTLARVEEESDNKGIPSWLLTHPAPADRVQRVQAAVQQAEGTAERFKADRDGHDRAVFLVAGIAPADAYSSVEPLFEKSLRSFRALSAAEAESINPNRVGLYSARQGDTWQAVAERQGQGLVKATTLAIMNGHAAADQPRPGERLKIVIGG